MVKGSFVGDELYKIQAQYNVWCACVRACVYMRALCHIVRSVCFSIIIVWVQPNEHVSNQSAFFYVCIVCAVELVLFFQTTLWRKLRSRFYDCIWFLWQHRFYIMLKSSKRNRRQVDSVRNIGKKRTINQLILLVSNSIGCHAKAKTLWICVVWICIFASLVYRCHSDAVREIRNVKKCSLAPDITVILIHNLFICWNKKIWIWNIRFKALFSTGLFIVFCTVRYSDICSVPSAVSLIFSSVLVACANVELYRFVDRSYSLLAHKIDFFAKNSR